MTGYVKLARCHCTPSHIDPTVCPAYAPPPETQTEREARWARERARQAEYRASPEAMAYRAARIAAGMCVLEDGRCVTHDVPDTMAHHFSVNPDASND